MLKYLILIIVFSGGCLFNQPTRYYSPNGKPFPVNWGKPPEIETKDYRLLPYDYGHGSSTLYHWIIKNIETKENNIKKINKLQVPISQLYQ